MMTQLQPQNVNNIHVLPVDDIKPHSESMTCKCEPTVEEVEKSLLITHHSFDGREFWEKEYDVDVTVIQPNGGRYTI